MAKSVSDYTKESLNGAKALLREYTEYGYADCLEETVSALHDCVKRLEEVYRKQVAKELNLKL